MGTVISTNSQRSYIVTSSNKGCARTVFVRGNLQHGYPARIVQDLGAFLAESIEVLGIERGNLKPATLGQAPDSQTVTIPRWPQPMSARDSHGTITSAAGKQGWLTSERGLTLGAGVFSKGGALVGVIEGQQASFAQSEWNVYSFAAASEVRVLVSFLAEQVALRDDSKTSTVMQAFQDSIIPVLRAADLAGGKGQEIIAVAFPVGTLGAQRVFATSIGPDVDDAVVQVRGSDGSLALAPVHILARDPSSTLTLVTVPEARAKIPRLVASAANQNGIQIDYSFCAWRNDRPAIECRPHEAPYRAFPYVPPPVGVSGASLVMPEGHLFLEPNDLSLGSVGAPIVDASRRGVVGMRTMGVSAMMMTSQEIALRAIALAPRLNVIVDTR